MASSIDVNDLLLLELECGSLDEEELLLLTDGNQRTNPEYPYWLYERFSLNNWNDDECWRKKTLQRCC